MVKYRPNQCPQCHRNAHDFACRTKNHSFSEFEGETKQDCPRFYELSRNIHLVGSKEDETP